MAKPLAKLDYRHKAACRLRVGGKNNDEIARELGVQKRTLVTWFSDPLVKDYISDLAAAVETEFAVELATSGMKALDKLTDMLDTPDRDGDMSHAMKLQIATELLDRVPALARVESRAAIALASQRQGGGGNQTMNVFANMSNEELTRFLNGGWREMVENGNAPGASGGTGRPGLPPAN